MEENFEFYNEKLYELRKAKGMSQEEFAEKVGVSRQSIYAWESGKSLPDIENLYKMCQVLEIKTNELTNLGPVEKLKEEKVNKRKIKKIIIRILLVIFIIYLIIALRQFFMVANLNKKINSIENYNNYSYKISRVKLENEEAIESTSQEVYYKDGILKVVYDTIFNEQGGRKEIQWIDFNNNESYIFLETDNEKTVRKGIIFGVEEPIYQIASITNNGLISEKNSHNLLASMFWPFKYFSYRVESAGEYYVLKHSTKNRELKYDYKEFICKENGFPYEKDEYRNDGKRLIEKYKEIKINETTDKDVEIPNLSEYTFVE